VTVTYATANGTATSGGATPDYTAVAANTMTFLAGTTTLTQTITVNVNGDTTVEADETFPVNATIATGTGLGTILNDDPLVRSIMAIQGNSVSSTLAGSTGSPGSLIAT